MPISKWRISIPIHSSFASMGTMDRVEQPKTALQLAPGFDKGNPHGVGGEVGGADGFQAEPGENLLAGWDREMRGEHVG